MRYLKALIFISLFSLIFSGCNNEKISNYDKIQKKLMNMNSYVCEAEVKYISNKSENNYKIKQWALADGKYKIETLEPQEIKGGAILFDGKMIWQYNPKVESKISLNTPDKPERAQINIFSFLNNMVKSKEVGVESATLDESLFTVFEAKIPGDSKFFSSEKLWVDNQTMLPARLEIYDTNLKTRIEVTFKNFEYNPKIEESVFSLDKLNK